MIEPGWYHGNGDPAGTVRYWDGQTWVGEPTTDASSSDAIYYAAVTQPVFAGALTGGPAAAAVNYRTTSAAEPAVTAVAPAPTPAIPTSAQFIAIGLSAIKAVPLALMMINTILLALFGTIGLQIAYNPDAEAVLALAVGFSLLYIGIGTTLVGAQALGAARNKPVLLLVPAVVMVCIDGFLTFAAWGNGHSTDHFFYAGLLVLQTWVLIGAIIGMVKTT